MLISDIQCNKGISRMRCTRQSTDKTRAVKAIHSSSGDAAHLERSPTFVDSENDSMKWGKDELILKSWLKKGKTLDFILKKLPGRTDDDVARLLELDAVDEALLEEIRAEFFPHASKVSPIYLFLFL